MKADVAAYSAFLTYVAYAAAISLSSTVLHIPTPIALIFIRQSLMTITINLLIVVQTPIQKHE